MSILMDRVMKLFRFKKGLRLHVVLLSLSPSSVTRKKTSRKTRRAKSSERKAREKMSRDHLFSRAFLSRHARRKLLVYVAIV